MSTKMKEMKELLNKEVLSKDIRSLICFAVLNDKQESFKVVSQCTAVDVDRLITHLELVKSSLLKVVLERQQGWQQGKAHFFDD